jgi:hypothetical protein
MLYRADSMPQTLYEAKTTRAYTESNRYRPRIYTNSFGPNIVRKSYRFRLIKKRALEAAEESQE